MSAPLPLLVPVPVLAFKAVAGTYAPLEDAVRLSFAVVRFPDGSAMTADDFLGAHAVLSRTLTATSIADVWDPDFKTWRSSGNVDLTQVKGVALAPPKSGATAWEGVLTGAGQVDAGGTPLIQAAVAHFPQYRLRGVFRAQRGATDAFGLGPESGPIEFTSAIAAARFGAELTPDESSATRARIVLRNGAAQTLGVLDLDASGGNAVITLANFDAGGSPLATITLLANGTIQLRPLGGMKVVIDGDLEANHIRYVPISGSSKTDLT